MIESARDKFIGCLLGLAIGDALGSRLEGFSAEAIGRANLHVMEFLDELWSWSRGRWTDDTKMVIALAESIVDAKGFDPDKAARKYLEWYESGDWRGIGNITQQSLANLKAGASWRESGVKADWAAGNGAAMRIAPIGLLDFKQSDKLRKDVCDDAIITHNNHEAITGSIAVAYAISCLARGNINITNLIPGVVGFIHPSETLLKLEMAQKLFEQKVPPDDALSNLGTSSYVAETVASSFYCFLSSSTSYETAIYYAVKGGNDTDTIAAITGALCGSHLGFESIPLEWREEVEDAQRIEDLAISIYELATGD